jgi:hypothetical protein
MDQYKTNRRLMPAQKRGVSMRTLGLSAAVVAVLLLAASFVPAFAHQIDYLAAAISPAATFNGASGNFTVSNPVEGGADIAFSLTFSIKTGGGTTTFPRTVTFGATTTTKPGGAADAVVSGLSSCTFASASSTCTFNPVTIGVPTTPGAYTVKIQPTNGTGGSGGLSGGGGVAITFVVAEPSVPTPIETALSLGFSDSCILYHEASVDFIATLKEKVSSAPVANAQVDFSVEGYGYVGSATTDSDGVATYSYSGYLSVGDHTVMATYDGDSAYEASGNSATLGVTYRFMGFQQPINADNSSIFGGKVVPVKIKIADANYISVSDAAAYVYFGEFTAQVIGTEAEALAGTFGGDAGNQMRYDSGADQYIFNWDVSSLSKTPNGTYWIRAYLGEGTCGDARKVAVSLKRKK